MNNTITILLLFFNLTVFAQSEINAPVFNGPTQIGNNNVMNINEAAKYFHASRLDGIGRELVCEPPITCPKSELTSLLEKVVYRDSNNYVAINITDSAFTAVNEVIRKYPLFPFAYYYRAVILKNNNISGWQQDALKALEILRITVQIDGHKEQHDQMLKYILNIFALEK